jgi:hypothetical protein
MDVKTTFLNGEIKEEVYIKQLEGFVTYDEKSCVQVEESHVWTKAGTSCWYEKMDGFLMILDFSKSVVDPNLYDHIVGDECLILVLYVGDLFLTGS